MRALSLNAMTEPNQAPEPTTADEGRIVNPAWATFWQETYRLHDLALERRAAKEKTGNETQQTTGQKEQTK